MGPLQLAGGGGSRRKGGWQINGDSVLMVHIAGDFVHADYTLVFQGLNE